METIMHILRHKTPDFHTTVPGASLKNAMHQMFCENTDHLVVMDEAGKFLGVVSEHDITTKGLMAKKSLEEIPVKEVMNTQLPMAMVNDSIDKCMRLLKQHHARFLAIFENFTFKGVISAFDFLEEIVNKGKNVFDSDPALQ